MSILPGRAIRPRPFRPARAWRAPLHGAPTFAGRAIRRLMALAFVGLAAVGCARNPVTGEMQPSLISEAEEIEMGGDAARNVEQLVGLVPEQPLQLYLRRMGADLAASTERPGLPWTFGVLDDPTPNAFSLPGGYVYITRGLLGYLDSEAELASVLGHEIGHVTARHAVTALSRARLAQLGLIFGGLVFPGVGEYGGWAGLGVDLLFLEYGRGAELQADDLAFRYALARGYDAREMVDVFGTLQRLDAAERSSALPAWLSTHPAPEARIRNLQDRIATVTPPPGGLRRGHDEYLDHLDGLVYGINPRNGFFRGRLFLHPDLRFQLSFPQGWQTQNLAAAVAAVAPDRSAVVQLTLAEHTTADAASRAFPSAAQVRVDDTRHETHNGLSAVVSTFHGQSEGSAIRGRVAFLEHRGRVFQLLAYTPASHFARYDASFRSVLASFAPLTDPRVLSLQPRRIRSVRLDAAMSLAEFHRRHPSSISLDELMILNQRTDRDARLPQGTIVKRVVGEAIPPS